MSGDRSPSAGFAVAAARAAGGAIVFSLPILMTLEMWHLGYAAPRLRLAVLYLAFIPLLAGISYYAGFEKTFHWKEALFDAFVAYAIAFVISGFVLALFAVAEPGMEIVTIVDQVSLQAIPASIGAVLARRQLGGETDEEKRKDRNTGYSGELFHMLVGAIFLAFSVAPTEEVVLIGHMMTDWHAILLALVSLVLMHAFVYAVEFQGTAEIPAGTPQWSVFLRFTVVGYAIALLTSLFILWAMGRTDGLPLGETVFATVVLGFPAAIGAASARLIL
jgi:putative integral membrane protein (TIGR02587 family)